MTIADVGDVADVADVAADGYPPELGAWYRATPHHLVSPRDTQPILPTFRLAAQMTTSWRGLAVWLLVSLAAGGVGALATTRAREFYAGLVKPSWAPPGWLFGPVWTVLYLLMGIAAWLVWRTAGWADAAGGLSLFLGQLVCNASWSWFFFAARRGALAFADIVLLLILIVATLVAFARVHPLAAVLLVPYLAWVAFATALTRAIWRANVEQLSRR